MADVAGQQDCAAIVAESPPLFWYGRGCIVGTRRVRDHQGEQRDRHGIYGEQDESLAPTEQPRLDKLLDLIARQRFARYGDEHAVPTGEYDCDRHQHPRSLPLHW